MYGYIYKTTNTINGLIYIGQHKAAKFEPSRYIGSGRLLLKAFKEFGKENFICELLDTADTAAELNTKEEYWVARYDSRNPLIGYNVKKGGQQKGLLGCCKIKRNNETIIVERNSVQKYLDDGWTLTNTIQARKETKKAASKKWYEKNKQKVLAQGKLWRENNKDRMKQLQTDYWNKPGNKERKRQRNKIWSDKHKAWHSDYYKQWLEKNSEYHHKYYLEHKKK